jgi:hypothetical protein
MGALARWDSARETLSMEGFYATEDGSRAVRAAHEGVVRAESDARAIGEALAVLLAEKLAKG